ncbi:hypothetical protein RZN22_15180 [Bacillaceae bacterium S4-13-58]
MSKARMERLLDLIHKIELETYDKTKRKLQLDKSKRILTRLDAYSSECEECTELLNEWENALSELHEKASSPNDTDTKNHSLLIKKSVSHLQSTHKLVEEGHYMSIYMTLGMSIGLVFGLTIFDNLALGLPIGMVFGIALGTSLDADAKKKGKTI